MPLHTASDKGHVGVVQALLAGGAHVQALDKYKDTPLTKATYKIESYDEVVPTVYRAYHRATEGEPGPVYIELPANLQLLSGEVGNVPDFEPLEPRPLADIHRNPPRAPADKNTRPFRPKEQLNGGVD